MAKPASVEVKKQVDSVYSIANTLRGTYSAEKYRDVIIPMTIIRRLECALEPTKEAVCEAHEKNPNTPEAVLRKLSKYPFYNTSHYTLAKLLADPSQIQRNFKTYIQSFSPNIKQILEDLEFEKHIDKMAKGAKLSGVVRKFSELDLNPATVNNVAMGYMFEEIIRRFSENAEAGDHYTPREVVRLLTKLALAEGCEDLNQPEKVIKVGDFACGTGGMLSSAAELLREQCPDSHVYLYGQEVLPESHAICLADMLIKGQDANNIREADTMKEDCFEGEKMRLVIMNPPFGQAWGGKDAAAGVEKAVTDEAKKPFGRFPAGIPAKGDMQMLFLQHALSKLEDASPERGQHGGRACIISNGSPLFSGGTSSGESQIRRWLLENDYVEAIIGMTTDLFYNTGIAIYIWVLSKDKAAYRKGRIQLIDATDIWSPMRRSLGKKRREISEDQIDEIVALYKNFEENGRVKILPREEFLYKEYTVKQPMQRSYAILDERINTMVEGKFMDKLHNPAKLEELQNIDEADRDSKQEKQLQELLRAEPSFEQMVEILRANVSDKVWYDHKDFEDYLKGLFKDVPDYREKETNAQRKIVVEKVANALSVIDKDAPLRYKRDGSLEYDDATKDSELVKLSEDVDDYFEREVYPYVPDAKYFDEESDKNSKTGAEFPFTRYFYEYEEPESSEKLLEEFNALEAQLRELMA